jgi:hypothetical protein
MRATSQETLSAGAALEASMRDQYVLRQACALAKAYPVKIDSIR